MQNEPIRHRIGDTTWTDSSLVAHVVWILQILHLGRRFFIFYLFFFFDFSEIQGVKSRVKP